MTFHNRGAPKLVIKSFSNDKELRSPPVSNGIFNWYTRLTTNMRRKQDLLVYKTYKRKSLVMFCCFVYCDRHWILNWCLFMFFLQLPVVDPFLEKVNLSDLGKLRTYMYMLCYFN